MRIEKHNISLLKKLKENSEGPFTKRIRQYTGLRRAGIRKAIYKAYLESQRAMFSVRRLTCC
jgi:hypothetical protein